MMENLKRMIIPILILAIGSGAFYIYRCYGLLYCDVEVLMRWDVNMYAFLMVLLVLGGGAIVLDFENKLTAYMNRRSFGIYVLHIPVLLVTNYLIDDYKLPMTAVYFIELISAFVCSILLYEIIHRISVLRYWILGERKKH